MKRVTILAAMHGDETYGIDLYKAFVNQYPVLASQVQLVVGNKKAYQKRVRFIDSDMNRHYGSKLNDHELVEMKRVKLEIDAFKPDYIIDIHTTRRSSGIFFISDQLNDSRRIICAMLDVDVCVMQDDVIKRSFIGNHENSVSLEYSLNTISQTTTQAFTRALVSIVKDQPKEPKRSQLYSVTRLITASEWKDYPVLKSYDVRPEGIAMMVPADTSEMDAEYYGFWCKKL